MCPGEELILTCTGQGTSQRWHITANSALSQIDVNFLFVKRDKLGTQEHGRYNFTLISSLYETFISTLSTVVTSEMNNTVAECTGHLGRDSATILLAGCSTIINSIILLFLSYLYVHQMCQVHLRC